MVVLCRSLETMTACCFRLSFVFFFSSAFFLQSLVLKIYLLSCYFLDAIPLILFFLSLIFPLSSSLSHLLSYLSFLFLASLPPLMHTKPSLRLPSTPSHRNEEIPPPASSRSVLTSKKRANERRTSGERAGDRCRTTRCGEVAEGRLTLAWRRGNRLGGRRGEESFLPLPSPHQTELRSLPPDAAQQPPPPPPHVSWINV